MKLAICVKSCAQDGIEGFHDIIRRTWGKDAEALGIDVRFFIGHAAYKIPAQDEVVLSCKDDYDSLPFKTKAILKWAMFNSYDGDGYDYVFLCDTDTFIIPELLLKCGYEQYDYAGRIGTQYPIGTVFRYEDGKGKIIEDCRPWASGGLGYFVSRPLMQTIVKHYEPDHWAEDLWVGQCAAKHGGFRIGNLVPFEQWCAWHFPQRLFKSTYDPKFGWMDRMYQSGGKIHR